MRMEEVGKLSNDYIQITLLVAETREHIQFIFNEFERVWDSMVQKKLMLERVVVLVKKDQTGSCEKVRVSGEEM